VAKNFAITGVGGYIAPRHLRAIRDTGNRLSVALDPNDSVGILDQFSFDVSFFTEFERFDRHVEKLRRGDPADRIDYVTVCAPNHLHDAHIRFALRVGADAICEKPLVLNPWNCDALQELEAEFGRRVYSVLQLRLHPSLVALKEQLAREGSPRKREISRQMVFRLLEGKPGEIGRAGHEHRDPFLRSVDLAFRAGAPQRRPLRPAYVHGRAS
jgi:UDP-N-acetyl-2-amino-2-deoxyglucuronate dehydrogenase